MIFDKLLCKLGFHKWAPIPGTIVSIDKDTEGCDLECIRTMDCRAVSYGERRLV